MNARLLILILLAAGLAIGFVVMRSSEPTKVAQVEDGPTDDGPIAVGVNTDLRSDLLFTRTPPPGDTPAEDPEFVVDVRVDSVSGKNQLLFDIIETHGYYVESLRVRFWRNVVNEQTGAVEKLEKVAPFPIDHYIKARETLTWTVGLAPAEIDKFGGDMGEDDDWGAEVDEWNIVRAENPNPLPKPSRMMP